MNPLQENLKENTLPPLSGSRSGIVARLQGTKDLVDGAIGKMREQEKILLEKKKEQEEMLLEKKRRIEEIAVLCEKSESEEIVPFAEILRETSDINAENTDGWTILMTIAYNHYK